MWKVATGTVTKNRPVDPEDKPVKKKKSLKKRKPRKKRISSSVFNQGIEVNDSGSSLSGSDEDESNWQGGPKAEEDSIMIHLDLKVPSPTE